MPFINYDHVLKENIFVLFQAKLWSERHLLASSRLQRVQQPAEDQAQFLSYQGKCRPSNIRRQ